MAYDIGNHYKDRYNKTLEEYVKSHTAGKNAFSRVSWRLLHNVSLALFHTQSQSRETVCDQVDPQKMYRLQNRKADQRCKEDCQHLCQIGG